MSVTLQNPQKTALLAVVLACMGGVPFVAAEIHVEASDAEFKRLVERELNQMRAGERGLVSRTLVQALDEAPATTTIKPLTRDDLTWHPNDRKGVRSHVVPMDTRVRGAERREPTDAVLYLHPSRINPKLSPFKLGTFPHELSEAKDLNLGEFSGNPVEREKRASFYRNAWRDAMGYPLLERAGEIETPEYANAKAAGLLTAANADNFPIIVSRTRHSTGSVVDISDDAVLIFDPAEARKGDAYLGRFELGTSFLQVVDSTATQAFVRFGTENEGVFEIWEATVPVDASFRIPLTRVGADFTVFRDHARLIETGTLRSPETADAWRAALPQSRRLDRRQAE